MKKYVLFVGVLGVFSLFAACTVKDKGLDPLDDDGEATVESSDSSGGKSSTEKAKSSSSTKASSSSAKGSSSPKDTTHQQVFVSDSEVVEYSYPSSGIFCWDENCDARLNSSSSAASSSSEKIVIEMSSESSEPPEVNGDRMTDKRDGKSYKLQNVAGKLWMAEDLNFETSNNSMCFDNEDANCTKYGRLYTYNAATRACPAGWRLPTRDEAQAIINADGYPWSYSGRCKEGNCDFTEKMGFHWTSASPQSNDKNYDSNKGDNFAVIIVEKEPGYAGENADLKFFQVDEKAKHFSVRCVQE
jgi:uncharacterized protein (TIGR02145 family)